MRRRDFITLLGSAAAPSFWPLAAPAQQIERVRRVGVLLGIAESEFRARFEPFRDELARLGWSEPPNLRIDSRWTDNKPDLANARARELVGLAPEVIYAAPGPAAEVLQPLTHTIPIVFSTSTDPVEAGYVQSYARPGGNMTGFTQFEASINTKYVQLLRDIAPNVTRIAILRSDDLARGRRDFALVAEAARSLGVTPVDLLVRDDPADFTSAIGMFAREQGGGLIVPPNNIYLQHRALIVALADQYRLPTVYNFRLFVEAGGLMSYGPDPIDNYRRPAAYVDRILRGAKPADLPVQAPTKYQLFINLKTAKALGLAISHEFLLTVDEVIE